MLTVLADRVQLHNSEVLLISADGCSSKVYHLFAVWLFSNNLKFDIFALALKLLIINHLFWQNEI